jgi:hypothetical protein
MPARRMTAGDFAAMLDRVALDLVEQQDNPPDLHPDDAAHLAFSRQLLGLRERQPAPDMPPWQQDHAGAPQQVGAAAVAWPLQPQFPAASNGVAGGAPGRTASRASLGRPARQRGPARPRRNVAVPIDLRSRLDMVALTTLLAAIALLGWGTWGWIDRDARLRSDPAAATPQDLGFEPEQTPAHIFGPPRPLATEPSPAPSTTALAAYPPPQAPVATGVATATLRIPPPAASSEAPATPIAATRSVTREAEETPMSATRSAETSLPPYPGPTQDRTAEPRVTRVGPPPVPTSAPTVPTAVPTMVATPTSVPPPPTPTGARPGVTAKPTGTVNPMITVPRESTTHKSMSPIDSRSFQR